MAGSTIARAPRCRAGRSGQRAGAPGVIVHPRVARRARRDDRSCTPEGSASMGRAMDPSDATSKRVVVVDEVDALHHNRPARRGGVAWLPSRHFGSAALHARLMHVVRQASRSRLSGRTNSPGECKNLTHRVSATVWPASMRWREDLLYCVYARIVRDLAARAAAAVAGATRSRARPARASVLDGRRSPRIPAKRGSSGWKRSARATAWSGCAATHATASRISRCRPRCRSPPATSGSASTRC